MWEGADNGDTLCGWSKVEKNEEKSEAEKSAASKLYGVFVTIVVFVFVFYFYFY